MRARCDQRPDVSFLAETQSEELPFPSRSIGPLPQPTEPATRSSSPRDAARLRVPARSLATRTPAVSARRRARAQWGDVPSRLRTAGDSETPEGGCLPPVL